MESRKTSLYRHYDKYETLLYVGISYSAMNRFIQHHNCSDWAYNSVRMDIEWFDNRDDAITAERKAIINEEPIYNKNNGQKVFVLDEDDDFDDENEDEDYIMRHMYKKTLMLLNRTKIPLAKICRDTELQERWMHRVKRDEIPDPGVKKIQRVYDYLKK